MNSFFLWRYRGPSYHRRLIVNVKRYARKPLEIQSAVTQLRVPAEEKGGWSAGLEEGEGEGWENILGPRKGAYRWSRDVLLGSTLESWRVTVVT